MSMFKSPSKPNTPWNLGKMDLGQLLSPAPANVAPLPSVPQIQVPQGMPIQGLQNNSQMNPNQLLLQILQSYQPH